MAGLYIHIPFCKQACHYCDFHFSTNTSRMDEMIDAIARELELQKDYLPNPVFSSIYFGGGTPSLLQTNHLEKIFNAIHAHYAVAPSCEITLEANPDDLGKGKLRQLKEAGINRLSIGIQSFTDETLHFLHRAHSAPMALACLDNARAAGFNNLSVDLIYGIPGLDLPAWQQTVETALQFAPEHFSAYALTIEEKTVFGRWTIQQKLPPLNEETQAVQFEYLVEKLEKGGYVHYEISNFCKPTFHAIHNSSYWKQTPYLGIGPSAHSYNLATRQFNVRNNALYLKALALNEIPCTIELLTYENKVNEYIFTTLRTHWGCDLQKLKNDYQFDLKKKYEGYLADLETKGLVLWEGDVLKLTTKGKLLADRIAADLFI